MLKGIINMNQSKGGEDWIRDDHCSMLGDNCLNF